MEYTLLSNIQKQFFVNSSVYPESRAYNIPSLTEINGNLDVGRLKNAWERIFQAMTILRSAYCIINEEPVMTKADISSAPWWTEECTIEELQDRTHEIINEPFDLAKPPLIRVVLFKVSSGRFFLLIVQHHIITDLFSKAEFAKNLTRAYTDSLYVPEVIEYTAYVEAESSFLQSPKGEAAREYWIRKTRNHVEPLKLPLLSKKPKPFIGTGRQVPLCIPPQTQHLLNESKATERIPFLTLLTAYTILLSRISGQDKFNIGVPFSNRSYSGDMPLIGPCVNILPVLIELKEEDSFSDIYARLRLEMLYHHRHQGFPFLLISDMIDSERDPLRPWFLQAGFTSEPPMKIALDGLVTKAIKTLRSGSQMDIFLTWWQEGEEWAGWWEYNDASYSQAEFDVWQEIFIRILESGLRDPAVRISIIPLVGIDELDRLSGADQAEKAMLGHDMTTILRGSCERNTDRTALVYRDMNISYEDFYNTVSHVASYLHAAYGSKGRVLVLFERTPEMLYALHGIVQSGNAYVPLGIDWPIERIADIANDIKPSCILTSSDFFSRFASLPFPVIDIGVLVNMKPHMDIPLVDIQPDDSMYILYTSGTTGRPKGAELLHSGIANRLLWMQDEYLLLPGERCLLKTPYTFDVSVWELFWPFMSGATLVISDEAQHKDPREILELIRREGVRIVHFVPSMLAQFLELEDTTGTNSLKDVICSGEALSTELVSRFYARFPKSRLHNLYGPTEASIDVTFWTCSQDDVARETVPIGRPIANTQIYILDKNGQPCPRLSKGEIFIGGVGLAKGYWNRPELTTEKFISNPFSSGKLYRTGDWGRYALDGAIEYLERKDTQTKIRGIRIELGEIESCLRRCENVENAVVIKGKTQNSKDCLIAYYSLKPDKDHDESEIRAELRRQLPANIIPEYFILLTIFPMNENGKLNRNALPDTPPSTGSTTKHIPAHLTGIEAIIGGLWEKALGHACENTDTNFFDAGGNSISLLALRKLLENHFGLKLKITDLFNKTTIADMASLLSSDENSRSTDLLTGNNAKNRMQGTNTLSNPIYEKD